MANVLGEIIATSNDVQSALDNLAGSFNSTTSDSNTPGAGLFDKIGGYFQSGVQALQGIADSNVVQQITGLVNQGAPAAPAAPAPAQTITAQIKAAGSSPILWIAFAAIAVILLVLRK